MKKHLKQVGSIVLLSALVASAAACSSNSGTESSSAAPQTGSSAEPAKLTKLSYWVPNHPAASGQMKTYAEMGMYKELEKVTGVKVEFQHPPLEVPQAQEQFNLMVATNELPDVIEASWGATSGAVVRYPGGPEKAILDKKIIKLNDLIDKYAPNLKKLLNEYPDWKKQISTDEGSIYAFPFLRGDDKVRVFFGPSVRQDWLDKLGLKMPTTIDEWYTVLKAFKEKDPNGNGKADEIPIYLDKNLFATDAPFLGAWGINYSFYQDGGKVKYGPIQPEYKEFLATMNKWYKEGLLDKDFAAPNDKLFDNKMTTNLIGATASFNGGGIGKYAGLMKDKDPKFDLEAAPYPVLKAGDKAIWGQKDFAYNGVGAAISTANKNPIETVKWLDYAYGDKGDLLFNYGVEGTSYKMENGKATFLPEILNPPAGTSIQQAIAKYNRATWSAPFVLSDNFQMQYLALPQQKKALEVWSQPTAERKIPLVSPTQDESSKFASIVTDIQTYQDEMLLKFIMGVEPISNFDQYVKKIQSMGIDEAIKIQQGALERFNKR
ncbi:ABC transporter substrate-binding protein [Paenibacillus sp. CGMCC 1.16610]|uniref:ABC transporter substrate-binding protein n=1 Tax=Paenibacillus anseongense TaxID=2682845 RepID=A0ABW9UCI2_9BACL|nr:MULTISPECIES: ABC transporter substrate-binding protein [Paenibacillus]MBA2943717.1 ABC transporter substrate-binding protein [Paenibacillus sp. CGMCC 1.16610]MVQ37623.1 ABC transporter substrate-binding protein [Paenibacillus anseongense]